MKPIAKFLTPLIFLIINGCAASEKFSSKLPITFLEQSDLSLKEKRLPFDHSWIDPGVDWTTYKGVFIKPVRSDLLDRSKWKASASVAIASSEAYMKGAGELATYFHDHIITEMKKQGEKHLAKLADGPGKNIAVVEIALTELVFSHPLEKAGSLAAPIPGSGLIAGAISDPYVTFALKVTDGENQKLLATAADRKFAPKSLINVNKLTATSANREICGLWAEEIAETFGSDTLAKISETSWKVLPW